MKILILIIGLTITAVLHMILKKKPIMNIKSNPSDAQKTTLGIEPSEKEIRKEIYETVFHTLKDLGCQPQRKNEWDMYTQYQGENLFFSFSGNLAIMIDPNWEVVHKSDPSLLTVYQAVAEINTDFGPTIYFSAPQENGNIYISSRYDIHIVPQVDNRFYLKDAMDRFFGKKYDFQTYLKTTFNAEDADARQKETSSPRSETESRE